MAKDHLLRHARLYRGGFDYSGFTREIGEMKNEIDFANLHAIADLVRWGSAKGHRQIGIEGYQALMDDTASTGSHTNLKAPPASSQVTILFGGAGVPAVGDPAYILSGALQIGDGPRSFTENVAMVQADFISDGSQTIISDPYGIALSIDTSISSTTNGTSVDSYDEASSANGGHATLHIIATSSGDYAIKIQDSPNDADWSDLITFTVDGSTLLSEQVSVTGTVDQFLSLH